MNIYIIKSSQFPLSIIPSRKIEIKNRSLSLNIKLKSIQFQRKRTPTSNKHQNKHERQEGMLFQTLTMAPKQLVYRPQKAKVTQIKTPCKQMRSVTLECDDHYAQPTSIMKRWSTNSRQSNEAQIFL